MAKNPAVLWYSSDYLVGVIGMTWEEQGRYVYLLSLQHERGHLDIQKIMPDCPETVLDKFVQDENGFYYNERMELETNKRQKYCESRSSNRRKNTSETYEKDMNDTCESYEKHMENENVNENININNININNINNNTPVSTVTECKEIIDLYNSICISLPKCVKTTQKRLSHIRRRLKEFDKPTLEFAFRKVEESDFLTGRSGDWRAGFDWIIGSEGNLTKILEGNYDNNGKKPKTTHDKLKQAHEELEAEYERISGHV